MDDQPRLPAFILRIACDIIAEEVGEEGRDIFLRRAGLERFIGNLPPKDSKAPVITLEEYQRAIATVTDVFDEDVARGIFMRAGRRAFEEVQKSEFWSFLSIPRAFASMDTKDKTVVALRRLMKDLTDFMGGEHILKKVGDDFIIEMPDCPYCVGVTSHRPVCYIPAAFYESALQWISGRRHTVKEITCRAVGDDMCRFRITWGVALRREQGSA